MNNFQSVTFVQGSVSRNEHDIRRYSYDDINGDAVTDTLCFDCAIKHFAYGLPNDCYSCGTVLHDLCMHCGVSDAETRVWKYLPHMSPDEIHEHQRIVADFLTCAWSDRQYYIERDNLNDYLEYLEKKYGSLIRESK